MIPKERAWIYVVIFCLLAAYGYFRFDGSEEETAATVTTTETVWKERQATPPPKAAVEQVAEKREMEADSETPASSVTSVTTEPESDSPAEEGKTVVSNETDEKGEEVAETPTVPRSELIGGAAVEWIPPRPKDPNDKFGEPPM